MFNTTGSMHNMSPRSSPAPTETDLPTNENIDANAMTQDPAVSIKVNLHKNMSSTLEQTPDNEAKPNNVNDSENPAVSIEGSLNTMSDTLGQIFDVLKGSTIAEELGKDDNSRFWATYKKVSTEYDDDFLRRANDDMTIILTFAGLFSAVNSTFIAGMQPNPGDTTNALLLHLIQITVNGPNSMPDISHLSSSTVYPPSTVWMQTLAYASLAFSVLAAFGAVLGKQWLHSYRSVRGRGSLEERGIERQMKLDGVEYFRLQTILQAFLVLLQISLLLFGLSLSARMWVQQTMISSVIMCTTAFGILFYVGTTLVSALRQDSPFQTPASEAFVAICQKILPDKFTFTPDNFMKLSAIRWILKTSTNPDIVETAAAIIPCVQWPPNLDVSAAFACLRHNFVASLDREELNVKYGKAMAHLCIQPVKIKKEHLEFSSNDKLQTTRSRFIRDAFMAGRAAYDHMKNSLEPNEKLKHQADIRTALRTMPVHGQSFGLSRPDDEELIWYGDLCWYHGDGSEPSCEEFDWLIDYLAGDANTDDKTRGDALLALSAMQGLGSPTNQSSYINSLIRCMGSIRPPRVRHTALRAVFEAREELASITSASMPEGVDAHILDELSRAVLTAVRPNDDETIRNTGHDASFHEDRDYCYIRLIYTLTKNDEWCQRLVHDGHLDRCISLVDGVPRKSRSDVGFYLMIIWSIESLRKDLAFSPAGEKWRRLLKNQWNSTTSRVLEASYIDKIPAFVTTTRLNLTVSGVPREWFTDLTADVHRTLENLTQSQAVHVEDGVPQATVDAALFSLQGLYNDLCRIIREYP